MSFCDITFLHQPSVRDGAIARRGLPNAQPVVLGDLSTGRCEGRNLNQRTAALQCSSRLPRCALVCCAEGTEISADFVRLVELQSDNRVKVIRDFPATGYKVQAAADGVRTWFALRFMFHAVQWTHRALVWTNPTRLFGSPVLSKSTTKAWPRAT